MEEELEAAAAAAAFWSFPSDAEGEVRGTTSEKKSANGKKSRSSSSDSSSSGMTDSGILRADTSLQWHTCNEAWNNSNTLVLLVKE